MSDKLSFTYRVTDVTMQTRNMNYRKETIEIPKTNTAMCTLIYRKYDCTKCQRRVRDDKWIEECDRVRAGRKGTCEAKFEHETSYVPADECIVCEMERRKREEEEEKQAEKDAMEQSGCSTS
ncbi:uncharacterized protein NECHADRAFT_84774 [Fusarium vanettenii 77-13-4]|uniref:Uncharacterized protein n=1 Tax=Fusarium vanettenii (strain ATCC MYA-4622 / CBS 123669 / FGSC 9596 / NRRL 45880 / 77-13-4) TaxID=660122 RepID=C7YU20_FUSV7|nr:uncharacterized protein NECHADRAFT_84774 [Fusarium vanettenii 77-13-4]EEU44336.1 predicted protein [Fusarium vanettenii 77-13-4]